MNEQKVWISGVVLFIFQKVFSMHERKKVHNSIHFLKNENVKNSSRPGFGLVSLRVVHRYRGSVAFV